MHGNIEVEPPPSTPHFVYVSINQGSLRFARRVEITSSAEFRSEENKTIKRHDTANVCVCVGRKRFRCFFLGGK